MVRLTKTEYFLELTETISKNPKRIQKQIAKQMGFSDSSFEKHRNHIKLDSSFTEVKTKKTLKDLPSPPVEEAK